MLSAMILPFPSLSKVLITLEAHFGKSYLIDELLTRFIISVEVQPPSMSHEPICKGTLAFIDILFRQFKTNSAIGFPSKHFPFCGRGEFR
jgi:hypothetical protein